MSSIDDVRDLDSFLGLIQKAEASGKKATNVTDWDQIIRDQGAAGTIYTKQTWFDLVTEPLGLSRNWSDRKLSMLFKERKVAKVAQRGSANFYCFAPEVVKAQHGKKAKIPI